MPDLDGKIAFVTGAGSGLGREIALTKAVAREVSVRGILVNAIAPGYIDTPILDAVGEAREVAATALFLAGPGASYFTGQVLSPNGGLVI